MNGDFSRQTFDPTRHYSTVRMQQGRVQLDADWNEQADLGLYRDETETTDVVGRCGAPLDNAAFGIVLDLTTLSADDKAWLDSLTPPFSLAAGDFVLTRGRYYVDGILCESEHPVPYTRQPDLPGLSPLAVSKKGFTVVYLDVWQRHLTWLDDPLLRETALGGPDTATRTRTIWQVRTVFVGTGTTTCVDDPPAYLAAIAPSTGLVAARAEREVTDPDPCLVPSGAGYSGLENQLYRVEIHHGGDAYDLDAGPGDHAVTVAAANQVVYSGGSWKEGDAVEIFRSSAGSDPMAGFLATIVTDDTGTDTLTLNTSLPDLTPADAPRIRPVEATYKWSRENGSIVTRVTAVNGRDLTVTTLGPDAARGFAPGQWVELIDELKELDGKPGFLAEIEDTDAAAHTVTLRTTPPAFAGDVLKLRRWDGVGAVKTNPPGTTEPFVELEDGVQVSFSDGVYKTGDYWLIPARTATADERSGTIEWPAENGVPLEQPPLGIRHHYCKLAILQSDGSKFTVEDCRPLFPPLTQLATLVYVGGDGQEALPGEALPQLLEVGVFRGRHPVQNVRVRFTTTTAGAKLAANQAGLPSGGLTFEDKTDANGILACAWQPANDLAQLSQQVEARLLDAGGNPLSPQVDFNAQLSVAREVAYEPGACDDLSTAKTVQEALDILCNRRPDTCCVVVEPGTPIDKILDELVKKKERNICLCLKPGRHRIQSVKLTSKELETVAIEGCGARAAVEVGVLQFVALDAVRLRGLDLQLNKDEPVAFTRCADVGLEDCRVTQAKSPGPACVIAEARRVRIENCVLDGGFPIAKEHSVEELRNLIQIRDDGQFGALATQLAVKLARDDKARKTLSDEITKSESIPNLPRDEGNAYVVLDEALRLTSVDDVTLSLALARLWDAARFAADGTALAVADPGGEIRIEATEIVGALCLYGDKPGGLPSDAALKALHQGLSDRLLRGTGSLHLQDVRVGRLGVDAKFLKEFLERLRQGKDAIPVHRALHVADTEVRRSRNMMIGESATLSAVDFVEPSDDKVGALVGDTAIVSSTRALQNGQLAVVAEANALAANVRINVVPV